MSELTHRVAAAVYIFRNYEILLLRRVSPPQTYAPPGGRLELNEDPVIGAVREVREECGLEVKIAGIAHIWFGIYTYGASPLLCINYFAEYDHGEPRLSSEHSDYVWASKQEIVSGHIHTQDAHGHGYRAQSFLEAFEKYEAWAVTAKR